MLALPAPRFKPYRIFSAGWGTQSTAALVLQAQGKITPYDAFVWANVGDDSEHPETIAYYHNHIIPFAKQHNIALIERQRIYKGKPITLYNFIHEVNNVVPLPMHFSNGGIGNRTCTVDFKIEVINRYVKQEVKASHVIVGIGFSRDEMARISKKPVGWHDRNWSRSKKGGAWKAGKKLGFWKLYEYPLTALMLTKADCIKLVIEAGLPQPPPSLCWWCPFQGRSRLIDKKEHYPHMFNKMVEMEAMLNERYNTLNNNPKKSPYIGFHPDRIPLKDMPVQYSLWDDYQDKDMNCDIGVCGV